MARCEHESRLRAELVADFGYFPATLAPADIERHRQLNAAADSAPSLERVRRKYGHLREQIVPHRD